MRDLVGFQLLRKAWVVAALVLFGFAATTHGNEIEFQDEDEKKIYALGLALAQDVAQFGLTEREIEIMQMALADRANRRTPRLDLVAFSPDLDKYLQERVHWVAQREAAAAEKLLREMAEQEGAKKTASGLVIRELQAGAGDQKAEPGTGLAVHYEGKLHTGVVFDSSYWRSLPVVVEYDTLIPCWKEALGHMLLGSKVEIGCPASLAYGDRGQAPMILPGSAIVFTLELLEIGLVETEEGEAPEPGS